jgi:hypothetical protein
MGLSLANATAITAWQSRRVFIRSSQADEYNIKDVHLKLVSNSQLYFNLLYSSFPLPLSRVMSSTMFHWSEEDRKTTHLEPDLCCDYRAIPSSGVHWPRLMWPAFPCQILFILALVDLLLPVAAADTRHARSQFTMGGTNQHENYLQRQCPWNQVLELVYLKLSGPLMGITSAL